MALQDNRVIQALSPQQQSHLVHIGTVAFGQAMRKNLVPYVGVAPTLRALRADGVKIVAVTNSGALQAMERVRRLGLAKLLDGLVAWNHDVTKREGEDGYEDVVRSRVHMSGLKWVELLHTEELKPNPVAYETALRRLGVRSALATYDRASLVPDCTVDTFEQVAAEIDFVQGRLF